MAKTKIESLGIFAPSSAYQRERTVKATADNSDLNTGKIGPVSAGLMTGEKAALKDIAAQNDLTINALMRFALRRFIIDVRTGKIDIQAALDEPKPEKKRLKLPN